MGTFAIISVQFNESFGGCHAKGLKFALKFRGEKK